MAVWIISAIAIAIVFVIVFRLMQGSRGPGDPG
jgi:hypothetical protein